MLADNSASFLYQFSLLLSISFFLRVLSLLLLYTALLQVVLPLQSASLLDTIIECAMTEGHLATKDYAPLSNVP